MARPGKFAARVTTVLASALLAVTVAAVPASAAPVPIGSAPGAEGNLAFYPAAGFGGQPYGWRYDTLNGCFDVPSGINNRTTAIVNKSPAVFDVYDGAGCRTRLGTILARTANDNIGSANNDRITSLRRR